MDPFLSWTQANQPEWIAFLKAMVEVETPSGDEMAITRFADLLEKHVSDIATVKRVKGPGFGPHLLLEFDLPGAKKKGQILGLAHSDTVHPTGTLQKFPFAAKAGRLFGPGVLDIKGGIAQFVFAARALRAWGIPVAKKVVLQINSDEEVGSDSSRALSEKMAKQSDYVLVVEPGTGLSGKLKTARKGTGDYSVRVKGIASHAGVDFLAGASAIVELAKQIEVIAGFTDLERGLTVNPGVIQGGTRTNVVAAEAQVDVDIRIARLKDFNALDRKFRKLKAIDKRCQITVEGGLNRPPMERSQAIAAMFAKARTLALDLDVKLEESATGGGSDGNFTAALGVPTLDGLGMVGEGAHTLQECLLLDRVADRTALLAKLIANL
ncbi:M20 family metallopeptidase [Bryobacter aggregatus]|uniref:M20 family metallopeptidase n=1 Tax=Bryobacter aggregatus TaxID=360054 RepID=UPI0004E1133F|nr:M20 family metallopeptidase [Bryobacter aggregatus]